MSQSDLQLLEQQLDQLLAHYQRLKTDYASVCAKNAQLIAERNRLQEKNELASHKVEAMLHRLRSLESKA